MNTLLITGVTGFLGGAALEAILNSHSGVNLLLLVRANNGEAAVARVKENLRKFNIDEKKLAQITSQNILLGDLASPEGFLSDGRLDSVTHVLNCAAVASFGSNPLIWKVNVEGTLQFAQRMARVEGLQRFLHVGTAMSCSPEPDSLVAESAEFRERAEHLVEYTHSKSTIEQLMQKQCPKLPLVIARPSIVVGHTHHGCQPSSSIFWVFSMGLMLQKFMCSMEDRIDVIPVDYCASALLMLLTAPVAQGEVVHISAGEENSVRFADIDKAMASALEQAPVGDKYAQVSYETLVKMRRELKTIFGPCNERLMLKAMRLYGAFATLNVRFSNDKLLSMGMPKPPRFTDYIDRCVQTTRGLTIPQQMAVDFK
ncbi:SDR family oxidoreductase [Kluyvera ascorbata]|uniref:SDR family oxidoreductase n=1 Tax=Kluyvera ascorbata TaxID=51288 RepID=UPI0004E46288|nr:SDR family oxidoreductase [Kluyvera ascorbata]EJG2385740.1 SDR family oxidoreductase [Kluyvera ascorbata]KFD06583.1 nucleoside-diphosphate-sugar epimerase [Kluyvera ascorbata ATCC 33433]MDU1195901.1 SDR family oxidoreductase [Kluyvera ascorbata]STW97627.1 Linear gramicidin synthase subunit D [Kluyvera ascorbata]BCA38404.1 NAD(P)H-binding protein [Kluyvera ascorbata]